MIKKLLILFYFLTNLSIAQSSWVTINEMPRPVYGGKAVVVDTTIFIVGGIDDRLPNNFTSKYSDSIRVFYPNTNTWGAPIKMIEARYGLIAVNYNDSLLYLGGTSSGSSNVNSLEVWSGSQSPYIFKTSTEFDRDFGTGQVVDDNLYLFGGKNSLLNFNYAAKINIQNGNTIFNSDFELKAALTNQASATDGNDIYLFGGFQVSVIQSVIKSIYKFHISTNTLTLLSSQLNKPVSQCDVVYMGNGLYYIIGGIDENKILSEVEIFDSGNLLISSAPPLNKPRRELTAVKYNNSIYVFGGIGNNKQAVKEVEKLDVVTAIDVQDNLIIKDFKLYNNYPNPFNPSTKIKYSVSDEAFVSLKIYNILGEEIKTLVNEEKSPGLYEITFNSKLNGNSLPSGVYFYRIQFNPKGKAEYFFESKKMILLK